MIKIRNWDKDTQYHEDDVVVFHDKIYIAQYDNIGIVPTPLINYANVRVVDKSGGATTIDSTIGSSNYDVVLLIVKVFFNSDFESHMNKNETWVQVQ